MSDLKDTGRIKSLLDDDLRASVFGSIDQAVINTELKYYAIIDYAHISMLSEQSIVSATVARALIDGIARLYVQNFRPMEGLPTDRGAYLAYENHLIRELGPDIGGLLQTGRSRNDLNATVFKLRLREKYAEVMEMGLSLATTLLKLSDRYKAVVFPAFTHYQTAFPSTFGHYLGAIFHQVIRDLKSVDDGLSDLDVSPLGACAGGGTSIPIDQVYTSQLLGFLSHAQNSVDAVASRDLCIRGLSSLAHLAMSISRLSSDLVFWSTNELGLITLPDELVGSSSNMPQKRNPFLLEMIKGRAASISGYWVSAIGAMHWVPYSNAVSVSGEATKNLWKALEDMEFILLLIQKIVERMCVNEEKALSVMEVGMVDAVYFAERMVVTEKIAFRDAHHDVGNKVNIALRHGHPLRAGMCGCTTDSKRWFDQVVKDMKYGGGAGKFDAATGTLDQLIDTVAKKKLRWSNATKEIQSALESRHERT